MTNIFFQVFQVFHDMYEPCSSPYKKAMTDGRTDGRTDGQTDGHPESIGPQPLGLGPKKGAAFKVLSPSFVFVFSKRYGGS